MVRISAALAGLAAAALLAAPTAFASPLTHGIASPGDGLARPFARINGGVRPAPTGPTGGVAPGAIKPPPPPARHPHQVKPGRGAADIPRSYLRLYRAAARRYGVDWRVLAAIGKNESDHARSGAAGVTSGRNFADCCSGPMQICTVASCGRVWQAYAIDGDGDGTASVYDPPDAIFAAARIVRDLQAVFGHNHPGYLLAAYNAGAAAVQRFRGVPKYPETRAYVSAGLSYMRLLRG